MRNPTLAHAAPKARNRNPGPRPSVRAPDVLVVAGLVALVCIPVWPGIYNSDAQFMLLEARHGRISRNYAPLHGWIWGVLDQIGIPPGVVFLLTITVFVTALLLLVKQFLPGRAARLTTAAIVVFPPVYGLLGLVSRDVWFATSALAITAAVWHVSRRSEPPSIQTAGVLVVFAGIAADARQNGAPFAILAVSVAALGMARRLRPHAATATRVGVVAVSLAVFFGSLLLLQRTVVTHRIYPEQTLYASDLVGVAITSDEVTLDRFLFPAQDLALLRSRVGPLNLGAVVYADPPIIRHRNEDPETNVAWARQWRRMLREHPLDYLFWRARLFVAQLGMTHGVRDPYFEETSRRDNGLSVANTFPDVLHIRNNILAAVEGPPGTGSFLVVPALYVVTAFGSLLFLARKRREWGPPVALLVVLGSMQAILFFTAPGSEFRFEYFQVVLGLTFCAVGVASSLCAVDRPELGSMPSPTTGL